MMTQAFSSCSSSLSVAGGSKQATNGWRRNTPQLLAQNSLAASHCSTTFARLCVSQQSQKALKNQKPRHSSIVYALQGSVEVEDGVVGEDYVEILKTLREAVDRVGGKSQGVEDDLLLRFLQGNSLNVEDAAKAFASHQEWRASFVPRGYISKTEIAGELNAKKSYLQGQDKQGRPIIITIARNHVHNKEDFDEFKKFIVYAIDKAIAAASADGKVVAIVDLKGLGFKNLDSKAFISGFDILQSHYPERIKKLYMINVPLIFNGLWKVVSPFINEVTREKIEFVDNKKLQETLLNVVDVDQLPTEYGGAAELVLLQDATVPNWPPGNRPSSLPPY